MPVQLTQAEAIMWNVVRLAQCMLLATSVWYARRKQDDVRCLVKVVGCTASEAAVALAIVRYSLGVQPYRQTKGDVDAALQVDVHVDSPAESLSNLQELQTAFLDWSKIAQVEPTRSLPLSAIVMLMNRIP